MRARQKKKNAKKAGTYTPSFYKFAQRMCGRIARAHGLRGYRCRGPNLVGAFTSMQDRPPYFTWHAAPPPHYIDPTK